MKTIWITGGSSGIGAATAKKFNENNWQVIISSRNYNKLNKIKNSILSNSTNKKIYTIKCDISDNKETQKIIKYIDENIVLIDMIWGRVFTGFASSISIYLTKTFFSN